MGIRFAASLLLTINSLNSLSSLITEDTEEAEKFPDEMSKVYRYLLRNNDDQLVEVETELQFIQSYFYLLKARYGDGVELTVNADESQKKKCLPPLTLQILLESAFNLNAISKTKPLKVEITGTTEGWLQIKNNIKKNCRGRYGRQERHYQYCQ